ncbi:MAG: putative tellurite resistance protein B-like protein [Planctomycetota bacterium]|jgi:uncharacterized tellurite resistance protein B-like protein
MEGAPIRVMELSPSERMNLMKFVCSFAWTDLNVSQSERDLVMRISGNLQLTDAEAQRVKDWLDVPPPAEEVDPTSVPPAHRQLFLTTLEMVVQADGKVVAAESESLSLFRDLIGS